MGIGDAEFFDLAPIEYDHLYKHYRELIEVEDFRDARLAYLFANAYSEKEIPFEDFLLITPRREKRTPEDLLLIVRAINDTYGGKVVTN
jgi:hypothetical protein